MEEHEGGKEETKLSRRVSLPACTQSKFFVSCISGDCTFGLRAAADLQKRVLDPEYSLRYSTVIIWLAVARSMRC